MFKTTVKNLSCNKSDTSRHLWVKHTCCGRLTFTLQLSIKYWAMDLTKASKKYQEYCRADKHQSGNNKEEIHVSYNHTPCNPLKKHKYVTFRSLLLVRKSVDGFRIAVMALANSSCTDRVVEDVCGSVLNTYCIRHMQRQLWEFLSTNTKCKYSELWYVASEFHLHIWSQIVLQPLLMALGNNVNHDSKSKHWKMKAW